MSNPFVILGIIVIGLGIFLITWGIIWINVYPSWMLFPLGIGIIITGFSLIKLMKDDSLYSKSSDDKDAQRLTK
jgi:hypothetical protein